MVLQLQRLLSPLGCAIHVQPPGWLCQRVAAHSVAGPGTRRNVLTLGTNQPEGNHSHGIAGVGRSDCAKQLIIPIDPVPPSSIPSIPGACRL